jgi:hypothetical protein
MRFTQHAISVHHFMNVIASTVVRLKWFPDSSVVVMAYRNRDIGRSYESGHEKRKKKAKEDDSGKMWPACPNLQNFSIDQSLRLLPLKWKWNPLRRLWNPMSWWKWNRNRHNHLPNAIIFWRILLHGQLLQTNSERHSSQPTTARLPTLASRIQRTSTTMEERGTWLRRCFSGSFPMVRQLSELGYFILNFLAKCTAQHANSFLTMWIISQVV